VDIVCLGDLCFVSNSVFYYEPSVDTTNAVSYLTNANAGL